MPPKSDFEGTQNQPVERSRASAEPSPSESRRVIAGRYEVREVLGVGAMGEVRRAHDRDTDREVALKLLPRTGDETVIARFLREIRLASELAHPGIVKVLEGGEDLEEKVLYVAMELLEGQTLEQRLEGDFDREAMLGLLTAVLPPLAAAHASSIVHRDLKPENVFIVREGGRERVKLLDFGIAFRPGEARATSTGMAVGTPAYMSPEQATHPRSVTTAADMWSFGVMLYEVLSGGRLPFEGETMAGVLLSVAHGVFVPLEQIAEGIDDRLLAVVNACLSSDPGSRPADAVELAVELRQLQSEGASLGQLREVVALGATEPNSEGSVRAPEVHDEPIAQATRQHSERPTERPPPQTTDPSTSEIRATNEAPSRRRRGWIMAAAAATFASAAAVAFWFQDRNSERGSSLQDLDGARTEPVGSSESSETDGIEISAEPPIGDPSESDETTAGQTAAGQAAAPASERGTSAQPSALKRAARRAIVKRARSDAGAAVERAAGTSADRAVAASETTGSNTEVSSSSSAREALNAEPAKQPLREPSKTAQGSTVSQDPASQGPASEDTAGPDTAGPDSVGKSSESRSATSRQTSGDNPGSTRARDRISSKKRPPPKPRPAKSAPPRPPVSF